MVMIDPEPHDTEFQIDRRYVGGSGAHYARVKLPDGSTVELKSRKRLDGDQWMRLARDYWAKTQETAEIEPLMECMGWDNCPHRQDRVVERGNAN